MSIDLKKMLVKDLNALAKSLGVTPGKKKDDTIALIDELGLTDEQLIEKVQDKGLASAKKAVSKKKTTARKASAAESISVDLSEFEKKIEALEKRVKELEEKPTQTNETKKESESNEDLLDRIEILEIKLEKLQDSLIHLDQIYYSRGKDEEEITTEEIEETIGKIEEAFTNFGKSVMSFDELMDQKEMRDASWYAVIRAVEDLVADEFAEVSEGASLKKFKGKFAKIKFLG